MESRKMPIIIDICPGQVTQVTQVLPSPIILKHSTHSHLRPSRDFFIAVRLAGSMQRGAQSV